MLSKAGQGGRSSPLLLASVPHFLGIIDLPKDKNTRKPDEEGAFLARLKPLPFCSPTLCSSYLATVNGNSFFPKPLSDISSRMPSLCSTLVDVLVLACKVLNLQLAFLLLFSCVGSISSYKERCVRSVHATCDISNLPASLADFAAILNWSWLGSSAWPARLPRPGLSLSPSLPRYTA